MQFGSTVRNNDAHPSANSIPLRFDAFGLCRPRDCPLIPRAFRIALFQFSDHVPQCMMVMGSLILGDTQPIHSSRRNGCSGIFIDDLLKQLFRIAPLLFHDGHARQSHQELCREIIFRQVSLDPEALLPVLIQYQNGWRPHRLEARKASRIFLDVNSDWDEVLFDKCCHLCITVRLGFQPSACPSGGSGAEVHQNRFVFRFGFAQPTINVFDPVNCHKTLLSQFLEMQWNLMPYGARLALR